MRFHQVLNEDLGCASYLLADGDEAVVVDPRWEVGVYLELAARAGARITHVVDTHHHADHVSGRGRLVRRTGATVHAPGDLRPGEELRAGRVRLTALATPGHRPEHVSFAVRDEARGGEPWCLLAGDSLLVGDVARPDLAVAPGEGARELHASLERIYGLGDHVELWPGHVGGSLCGGGALSPKTSSTIGYERRAGATAGLDRDAFLALVSGRTPPKPPNVARIVALNQGPLDTEPAEPAVLRADELDTRATVLDARTPEDFDRAHLRGALALGRGAGRVTRVGWAVDPAEPLVVIDDTLPRARLLADALHALGLWNVVGVAAADPEAWFAAGLPVASAGAWDVDELALRLRARRVGLVDVRDEREYAAGHVPGSVSLPLHVLGDGRGRLARADRPLAVACAVGGRAAFGASLLRRAGHADVVRVAGGGVPDLAARGIELAA